MVCRLMEFQTKGSGGCYLEVVTLEVETAEEIPEAGKGEVWDSAAHSSLYRRSQDVGLRKERGCRGGTSWAKRHGHRIAL